MKIENVRDIIALMVVGSFLLSILALGIIPPLWKIGEPTVIQEHLKLLTSLLTGAVGTVLGFYFGKSGKGPEAGEGQK